MNKHPVLIEKTEMELYTKIADLISYKTYLKGELKFVLEHIQQGYTKHKMVDLLRTNIQEAHKELEELRTKLFLLGG